MFRPSRGSSVGKCPFKGRCLGSRTEKSYCLRSAWAYFGKNSKFNPLLPVKPIKWSDNFDGQSFLCRVSVALALRVARSSQHHLASFFCITLSFSPPRFCSCGASRVETLLPQLGGDEQDDGLQVGQVRSEPWRRGQGHPEGQDRLESSHAQAPGWSSKAGHRRGAAYNLFAN